MDGRGRLRKDAPWGWQATTWQAWTFLLAALLLLTNAGWFYTVRVERSERAQAAPAGQVHASIDEPPPPAAPVSRPVSSEPAIRARLEAPLRDDERCLDGQRFRVTDRAIELVGPC